MEGTYDEAVAAAAAVLNDAKRQEAALLQAGHFLAHRELDAQRPADGNARDEEGSAELESGGGEDGDSSFRPSESEDEGGSNSNRFDLLIDGEESSSSDDEDSSDVSYESEEGGSNSNRFDLLMDEESSSCDSDDDASLSSSDGGSRGNATLDSNPFNVLIDDESSSEDGSELTEDAGSNASDARNLLAKHDNDGEDSLDDDSAKCAVCFLPDDQGHTWRRLLTLPCCGSEGREASSSTRFCAACILRVATTKTDPSVSSEFHSTDPDRFQPPAGQFYRNDVQTDARRVIECPRCRDLLVVKIKQPRRGNNSDDESTGCDCPDCLQSKQDDEWAHPKNAKSCSVRVPTFEEKVRYAGKKVGAAGPVAGMLWRAAFLHHTFMPGVCLGPESDCDKLVRWGILQKAPVSRVPLPGGKKKDVFQMDRGDQAQLIELFDLESIQDDETYALFSEDGSPGFEESANLVAGAGLSIIGLAMTWRPVGALRMLDRFLLLLFYFKGYVPMFPISIWRQWVVTALNVFIVTTLLQFLFVTLVYTACFLGVGLTVCYFLRHSNKPKAIWWQVVLAAYFAWRAAMFVWHNPSITWLGWVSPKSITALKNLIWA